MLLPGLRLGECVDDDRLASSGWAHYHTRVPRQHCFIQLDHLIRLHNDDKLYVILLFLSSSRPPNGCLTLSPSIPHLSHKYLNGAVCIALARCLNICVMNYQLDA